MHVNEWTKHIINQAKGMNVEHAKQFIELILENESHSLYKGITVHPEPNNFYGAFVRTYRNWEETGEMEYIDRDEEQKFYDDIRDNRINAIKKAAEILGYMITIRGVNQGSYDRMMDACDHDFENIIIALAAHKDSLNKREVEKLENKYRRDAQRQQSAIELQKRKEEIVLIAEEFKKSMINNIDIDILMLLNTALLSTTSSGVPLFTDNDKEQILLKVERVEVAYLKEIEASQSNRRNRYYRLLKTKKAHVLSAKRRPITKVYLAIPDNIRQVEVSSYSQMYMNVVTWLVNHANRISILLDIKGEKYPLASTNILDLSNTCRTRDSYKRLTFDHVDYMVDTHGSTIALEAKAKKVIEAYGFSESILTII